MRIVLALACWVGWAAHAAAPPTLSYRVIAEHRHALMSFTQGLVIVDGQLIEGTGLYGESRLSLFELPGLRPLRSTSLDPGEFGEGVAVTPTRIFQLTWQSRRAYVYDRKLQKLGSFPLTSDGWGLAYDGKRLIRSDGSSRLQFLDPERYVETGHVVVREGSIEVDQINELEWVDGRLYANLWQTDRIAVIDPVSGQIMAWLDLTGLAERFEKSSNWNARDYVLNGIAFDERTGHFWITGKYWPLLFEIAVDLTPLKRNVVTPPRR
ncbi:glutaminyl-peptide cyclotransferase [Nevskia sp.]|uniref:glutaminyl-peptide cyclotransferase n=1 Tax=Nevskia sp. TaxID=1929292 RepID=UPI0025E31E37|nr:glutaminyl-peptide cyclotransferase [Nevskia sp.]